MHSDPAAEESEHSNSSSSFI